MTQDELLLNTLGYSDYKHRISSGNYPANALPGILAHRNAILERKKDSASRQIKKIIGMGYTEDLLIPLNYDGAVVDPDDVFAALYIHDYDFGVERGKDESYTLWILLTNDAYLSVLPMVYLERLSFFDRMTKKEKNDFLPEIEKLFRNLKYPVCSLEEFQNTIRLEPTVKGKIGKSFLSEQFYDASMRIGLFDPWSISCEFGELTRKILTSRGYSIPS